MSVRICLLVTDDPDSHEAISEALSGISEKTVVVNILDSRKALLLLQKTDSFPDFLFVDLTTHDMRINSILAAVRGQSRTANIPIVVLGHEEDLNLIKDRTNLVFIDKDWEYTRLRKILGEVVTLSPGKG